jgi:hypothetical protein
LREELEVDGLLQNDVTLSLFLCDICDSLGLSQEEKAQVLGEKVAQAIEQWRTTQVWPVEQRETAAHSPTRLAAVPV